ncbi:hypothetical protein K3M67_16805 (plasmid) [Sphingobium sp. V4]|uniref:hypothetical protein n=1 Tax=Sphingobium sp. V4 TaxID=3038927 RepID=UPI002557E754|nr:hypothetical protein [Sphingobium sp. V4]WIW90728.1 hypothetical protein K3M67_16805 [Sphingobium sp. V4]
MWSKNPTDAHRRLLTPIFLTAILAAVVLPMFFDAYRTAYYGTMSFDNYSRYLLWFLGEPGGELPPSPHVYRLGSVIMAAPFYHLPLVLFSGEGISHPLVNTTPEYAKALQAMCAANAVYASLSAVLATLYLTQRRDVPLGWAFSAALVFLMLTRYLGMGSADGIATPLLMITAIAMIERKVALFAIVVILGTVVNEKVALIALLCAGFRALLVPEHRKAHFLMAGFAAIALAAYAVLVLALALPGLENQRDPSTYFSAIASSVRHLTNPKGVYQNLWPVMLLLLMWWASLSRDRNPIVYGCDVGVVAALFLFALALDVQYNLGRIMMFVVPLFLLGAIANVSRQRPGVCPPEDEHSAYDRTPSAPPTAPLRYFAGAGMSKQP